MFGHYLTIGWRNLRRGAFYTAINILSLSIGVAASVLIFLYVQFELTYDQFHKDSNDIYLVQTTLKPQYRNAEYRFSPDESSPPNLADAFRLAIPGAQEVIRIISKGNVTAKVGSSHFPASPYWVDSNFFSFFSFALAQGDAKTALSDPSAVVLHPATATQLFGATDVIGRTLTLTYNGQSHEHRITGIMAEYPGNSTYSPGILLPISTFGLPDGWDDNWINTFCNTLIRIVPGTDTAELVGQINQWMDVQQARKLNRPGFTGVMLASIVSLPQLHFQVGSGLHLIRLFLLIALGLAILVIASVNFVTLSIARSMKRAQEIGMRKVFGAVRGEVMRQFWSESFILAAIALVFGLMLAELLLPTFSSLFGRHLALDMTSNLLLIPVLLGLLAILAFGAGSVPALVLARLRPIAVLQKQSEIYRGGIVSRSLVVVQLALSLVLLISATGVLLQLRYVDTKPLGYTKDHVIMLTHHATTETAQQMSGDDIAARMRTELADDPRVLHIAPVPGWASKGFESMMLIPLKGEDVEVDVYVVDEEFIPALDIRLLAGRNFATDRPSDLNNSVIVNEAFTRTIGLANPVGTQLPISSSGDGDALVNPTVIGVVQDFHSRPLVWSIHPAILRMGSRPPKGFSLIKIAGDDYQSTLASIETAWNRVTGGSRFQYSVLAEDLAISYYAEENFLKLISYSAAASLMVALLGLFALAGLRAVSRLKEVSIRKVMGASVPSLLRTLNTEFALIVCVANLIAWPVAYYILNRWLAAFVYRIELTVWPFLLIGLATSATALAVVSYHTIKAASTNPAQVLRHE